MLTNWEKLVKFGNDLWYLFTEYSVIVFANLCFIALLLNTVAMVKNEDPEVKKYKRANMFSLLFFGLSVLSFFIKILVNRSK